MTTTYTVCQRCHHPMARSHCRTCVHCARFVVPGDTAMAILLVVMAVLIFGLLAI